MRKISYILFAFLLAILGVSFLRTAQGGDPRRDALLLFLLAGLIFILTARPPIPWPGGGPIQRWAILPFALTSLSVLLAALAVVLFARAPRGDLQFTGPPLLLWLLSIPLFIAGAAIPQLTTWATRTARPQTAAPAETDDALTAPPPDDLETTVALFPPDDLETTVALSPPDDLETTVALSPPPARPVSRLSRLSSAFWKPETIGLIVILLVALILRLYQIQSFPNGCQSDECNNGRDALEWLSGAPYTPYAETNEGQATLFTYLIAGMFQVAGAGVIQMRLVSAIAATLSLLAFYYLARELFDWRIALVSTALFAVSRWHLTFSRIVYELILVPLVESLLFLCLIRAVRYNRRTDWAWAGLLLALGMNTYTGFRVVPFVVVIFLLYWLVTHWRQLRQNVDGLLVMAAGAFVGIAPLGVYIIQHWSVFIGRTRHISIFEDIANAGGSLEPLRSNLDKVLWSFHWRGDLAALNNLPGAPLLDVVVGALVILGLAYILRHFWQPFSLLALVWIVAVGSLAVLSVAHEAPTARRPIGLLPIIYLLVALALDRLWDLYLTAWRLPRQEPAHSQRLAQAARPFLLVMTALALYVGAANADTFFNKQAADPAVWRAYSPVEAAIGHYLRDLPTDAQVYLSPAFERHSAVDFISRGRYYTLLNLAEHLPLRQTGAGGDVVYIMETLDTRVLPLLRQVYPAGQADDHRDPFGAPLFLSYRVSAEAIAQGRGLIGRFYAGDAPATSPSSDVMPIIERRDAPLDFDWRTATAPLQAPFHVRWQGAIFASGGYGQYAFELTADGASELWLDDKRILAIGANAAQPTQVVTQTLAGGFHSLALTYNSGRQPGRIRLAWRGPDLPPGPIPADALYALEIANSGLVGYYYPNADASGAPTRIQRDIFILPNKVASEPFSIVWRGKVAAPQSGQYLFGARADDGALVYLNGALVVDNGGSHGSEYREGRIALEQGFHDIEVKYWQVGGSREMQLWWQPPTGAKEIIPSTYLFPIEDQVAINIPLPPPPMPAIPTPSPSTPSPSTPSPSEPSSPALPPASTLLGALPVLSPPVQWRTGACGAADGQFSAPRGVAVGPDGSIYVADMGNHRIVKLDQKGQFVTAWGRDGEGEGQFLEPMDLGVASDGSVIVLDAVQQRLQSFSPNGQFLAAFGAENTFYRPRGLWVQPDGSLWVADTGGIRVLELNPAGQRQQQIGGRENPPVGHGQPTDVVVGPAGDIWVTDSTNGILWHLAADATIIESLQMTLAGTLDGPHLAVEGQGVIYVTDPEGFRVVVLAPNGTPIGQIGQQGNEPGQFRKPVGIAADAEGRVFVADAQSCQVTAFAPLP